MTHMKLLVSLKFEQQHIVNCQVISVWILGVTAAAAAAGVHRVENLWQC